MAINKEDINTKDDAKIHENQVATTNFQNLEKLLSLNTATSEKWVDILRYQIEYTNNKLSNIAAETPEFLLMFIGFCMIAYPIFGPIVPLIPERHFEVHEFITVVVFGSILLLAGAGCRLYRLNIIGKLTSEVTKSPQRPIAQVGSFHQKKRVDPD